MGFFSELDRMLRENKVSRPFRTPIFSKYLIDSYKKGRKTNEQKQKECDNIKNGSRTE